MSWARYEVTLDPAILPLRHVGHRRIAPGDRHVEQHGLAGERARGVFVQVCRERGAEHLGWRMAYELRSLTPEPDLYCRLTKR